MARAVILAVVSAVVTAGAAAYSPTLDLRAIDDAIAIGLARDAARAQFHRPYRIPLNRPPFDFIDLVTPFRRMVLLAEERAQAGGRLLQRDALDALAAHGTGVQLRVELIFHPQNTYVGVPPYVVRLAEVSSPPHISARGIQLIPRFTPQVGPPAATPYPAGPVLPSGGQPVLGGLVIADFDAAALDPEGVYDIVVEEGEKELVRVAVDLGALR